MKAIIRLLFIFIFLSSASGLNAQNMEIKHIIVFGDSLSDRGYSQEGGFNRYSNGKVWPEYLSETIQANLADYAWGGAKTGMGNYHGMEWSGLLWQVKRFPGVQDSEHTLAIIWIGVNDLIDGADVSEQAVNNIASAIDELLAKNIKHIVLVTLPDITLAPAYNDKKLPDYEQYAALKGTVKSNINQFNQQLGALVNQHKQLTKAYTLNLIDIGQLYNNLASQNTYQNIAEPWLGTYSDPQPNAYMWWDAWHPMTDVHRRIAQYLEQELQKIDY